MEHFIEIILLAADEEKSFAFHVFMHDVFICTYMHLRVIKRIETD